MSTIIAPQFAPASRWKQDVGIRELIEYFDQSRFLIDSPKGPVVNWDALSSKDWETITREAGRCQENFVYAARNYFWITNKQTGDQLFTLWECQEMILELIMSIRDKGLAQKLIILKARQLGISTLIEALIAWETMFYPNINAVVVGPEKQRSEYLFSILLHIYDQLPWWLKPMCASREYAGGLLFDNPNPDKRRLEPGLKSRIEVQSAGRLSGVGQGIRLSMAHISEFSDFQEDVARSIVDEDLGNALAEFSPMTLAVIESTAKGAGKYYHELYVTNKDAGDDAAWRVIFIPAFMEKTRVLAPPGGWLPHKIETAYRDQVKDTWVRCDNSDCGRWKESTDHSQSWLDEACPYCSHGVLRSYILTDEQLRFMQWKREDAARKGIESVKKLRQELSINESECFQLSGDPVFPEDCLDFAGRCVRKPRWEGSLDSSGHFHAVDRVIKDQTGKPIKAQCIQDWCDKDHRFDRDKPLSIWEKPIEGYEYSIGVDVAEGLGGRHDYSVVAINRIGKGLNADVQVALWRSNEINHYDLAIPVVHLGEWYNWALVSIEYNIYQTCGDDVRIRYNYPNLYRWKHLDAQNIQSNKWHWLTSQDSKSKLWGNAVRKLRGELWYPRSGVLVEEMKKFQKDDDSDRKAAAERGFHDDTLMASMIALYCPRDTEQDDRLIGRSKIPGGRGPSDKPQMEFDYECLRCGHNGECHTLPDGVAVKCSQCGSILLKAKRKGVKQTATLRIDTSKMEGDIDRNRIPSYDEL